MRQIITDKYNKYRLKEIKINFDNTNCSNQNLQKIIVDDKITYQTIKGFGGAFTESACYNLSRVNQQVKEEALKAYFSVDGLNYNLGRIHMNGCDFALSSYNYVKDYDITLDSFNISRDLKYVIPTIKDAEKIKNSRIDLMVSTWSPCWWMKDNKKEIRGGHLLEEYAEVWANYYVRYLQELEKNGISVFGLSTQNEPAAIQRWDSCIYSATQERDFIKNYLGPALNKANIKKELYIWDHNRDIINERVEPIYNDRISSQYVYGVAVHWYDNEPFENLKKCHDKYPNKHIISSESCIEGGPKFGVYETGERYGRNIIGNFNNYCEAFIDWNLYLDETGGPTWVNNLCDAPVMILVNQEKIVYQSSYYYIGHFSKYIKAGAKRIYLDNTNNDILSIAFKNPNQEIIIIMMNQSEDDYNYEINTPKGKTKVTLLKRSIMTLIEGVENE